MTAPVGLRHDADDTRQERQRALPRLVEQAFGGELALALLELRHERAEAGGLQRLDDDLILGGAGKGGDLAGGDDLHALLGLELERPQTPRQTTASIFALSSFSAK